MYCDFRSSQYILLVSLFQYVLWVLLLPIYPASDPLANVCCECHSIQYILWVTFFQICPVIFALLNISCECNFFNMSYVRVSVVNMFWECSSWQCHLSVTLFNITYYCGFSICPVSVALSYILLVSLFSICPKSSFLFSFFLYVL